MRAPTYKIYTLGCKVNQYDSGVLGRKLKDAGFLYAEKNVDIAVINTCAVTKTAIHKSKRALNKARKENPKAKLALIGCWPQAYPQNAEKMGVDLIRGVGDYDKLLSELESNLINKSTIELVSGHPKFSFAELNRSRYFIKIQDGCEQFCTYCIIPYTRGKLRSIPKKEVIAEIKSAIEAGYKEIVLSGIHLGLYGREIKSDHRESEAEKLPACRQGREVRSSLFNLLKKVILIPGLGRIRLSSIEINEVNDELINLIAGTDKICNHLHIPLQSGCDKILKLMKRPYDRRYFMERINKIRAAIPEIAITTDVIVGFPGESDWDFRETVNFIKKIKFSKLHVFPFSAHEKTRAANMSGQVDKKIKQERADILRKFGKKCENEYKNKFSGKNLEIIVKNNFGNNYTGKSEYYFDVDFISKRILYPGSLVYIKGKDIK